jgi:galactokinase
VGSLRDTTFASLERSNSALDATVHKRARHVIGEIERTQSAAKLIKASDWKSTGELMYASHDSLRDDYEVSCLELDAVVEIARSIGIQGGVYGCRMTGGGFGGCTVALVKSNEVAGITNRIATDYEAKTGIKPSLFVSRPAAGAALLRS